MGTAMPTPSSRLLPPTITTGLSNTFALTSSPENSTSISLQLNPARASLAQPTRLLSMPSSKQLFPITTPTIFSRPPNAKSAHTVVSQQSRDLCEVTDSCNRSLDPLPVAKLIKIALPQNPKTPKP